jgi:hypothetical protein
MLVLVSLYCIVVVMYDELQCVAMIQSYEYNERDRGQAMNQHTQQQQRAEGAAGVFIGDKPHRTLNEPTMLPCRI